MKTIIPMSFILALGTAALPAHAQSNGSNGAAPVAGEGPGGSGAGQPTAGPSKSSPGAVTTDSTMMMKKPAGATPMMSTVGENPKAGQIKGGGDPMLLRNGTGTAQAPAVSTGGPTDANPSGQ